MDVINTTNLSKYYGKVHAVKNISLSVRKGEIYGFLGLNGAGKTTVIRMLLGMIRPSSGAAYLMGKKVDPGNYRIFKDVGYIVETPYSYPELTVLENLEIIRKLRNISDMTSVNQIIKKLKLDKYKNVKAKHLSLGNAQRLGLAKALLHQPQILILDEPFNGLDPVGIVEIRELLYDLAQNHGVTIFISSHILDEISKLASRIGIIHNGVLIQEINYTQLSSLLRRRLLVSTLNNTAAISVISKAGYSVNSAEDGILEIDSPNAIIHPEEISRILVHANCPPVLLKIEQEDLERYFLRIIQEAGGKIYES